VSRLIATVFGVGLLPGAPGTWGSLAALPVGYALHWAGGFPLLLLGTAALFLAGYWATARETAGGGDPDPGEIVVDEVVGQWIALFPLSGGLWAMSAPAWLFPWPGWVGAFVMFRIFDIWKPWPVSWADRQHGALGVMLDDVLAGLMAAVVVMIAAAVSHAYLM
jgi:phosphatidylglycerophosphatase A